MESLAVISSDRIWGKALALAAVLLVGMLAAINSDGLFREPTRHQLSQLQNADIAVRTALIEKQKIELGKGDPEALLLTEQIAAAGEAQINATLASMSKWERVKYRYRAWRLNSRAGL